MKQILRFQNLSTDGWTQINYEFNKDVIIHNIKINAFTGLQYAASNISFNKRNGKVIKEYISHAYFPKKPVKQKTVINLKENLRLKKSSCFNYNILPKNKAVIEIDYEEQ